MWDSAYMNPLGYDKQEADQPNPQEQHFSEAAKKRYDYCVKMAMIFKSPEGQEILKIWRENTIEAAAWMPSISAQNGREAAIDHAFAREGQNAFVRDIEQCIDIAHSCKDFDDFCARVNQLGTI